jgi:hypothetical protein
MNLLNENPTENGDENDTGFRNRTVENISRFLTPSGTDTRIWIAVVEAGFCYHSGLQPHMDARR